MEKWGLVVDAAMLGFLVLHTFLGWRRGLLWQAAGMASLLLGVGLGLGLLLPFVLLRSLGGGDWKLVGALGAFLGPPRLIAVLLVAVLVAGVMALILVIWKRRIDQTLRNLGHMLAAFFTLHLPGPELSLDNPESLKVPFGVAVALAVVLYTVSQAWGLV